MRAIRKMLRASVVKRAAAVVATCVWSLLPLVTFAAATEKPFAAPQVAVPAPVATAGSLAQVTLSLLLVLAAVFAAAWLMKRLRGFGRLGANAIQVLADAPLGTKERAVLIQVGNQQLLLGVAPGRVNVLHILAEQVGDRQAVSGQQRNVSLVASELSDAAVARPDFKAILKRSLGL